jgi:hypothetical protein
LYLDADTICTRTLGPLIERITRQRGDFIYVQPWIDDHEWRQVVLDPAHQHHAAYVHHVSKTIGRGPLARFDPDHDCLARYPFNTGAFASRRLAIKETDFASLNRAERTFHHESPDLEEWTWRSSDLFFRDQGRLNYLVGKLSIPVYPLRPDLICPAGASAIEVTFEDIGKGTCGFHLIHWMGAKSPGPSLFCTGPLFRLYAFLWSQVGRANGRWVAPGYERLFECVGYSLWRHYREQLAGPISWRERLRWSWIDLKKTCRLLLRYLKLLRRRASLRSVRGYRRARLVPPESTG